MKVKITRCGPKWLYGLLFLLVSKVFYDIVGFLASDDSSSTMDESLLFNHYHGKAAPTNGIAACLLVLDDTTFLKEWLAYHYTVLPLSSLIIALDPKNSPSSVRRIQEIANRYNAFKDTKITFWYNDTFIHDDEIRDSIWKYERSNPDKDLSMRFKKLKKQLSSKMNVVPQRERQCQFVAECMKEHKRNGQSWVLLTDTDEFLVFNYIHKDGENHTQYDNFARHQHANIDKARKARMPIRQSLPPIHNTTVAEFLRKQQTSKPCYRIVGLKFGNREASIETVRKALSPEALRRVPHPEKLVTVAHRSHRKVRDGKHNKVMVDVSRVAEVDLTRKKCYTIHNANSGVCSQKWSNPTGQDYISSIFRIHHYLGSLETFLERKGDYRGGRDEDAYKKKLTYYEPAKTVDDDDIRPWLNHFVKKVGPDVSRILLE